VGTAAFNRYVLDARRTPVKATLSTARSREERMDEKRKRGANAILVVPLIAATAAASRLGDHVRTVDFLQIFSAGLIVGVCLVRIFQLIFDKKKTAA
jgi:hypothetical protein